MARLRVLGLGWVLVLSTLLSCFKKTTTAESPDGSGSTIPYDAGDDERARAIGPATATGSSPRIPVTIATTMPPWVEHFKGRLTFKEKHEHGVLAVAFVPGCVQGVSSGSDGTARIWDLQTGGVVRRFQGPRFQFRRIAVTRDARRAVSTGDGANYWDLASGELIRTFATREDDLSTSVALSDEQGLVAVGFGGRVAIWELESGKLVRQIDRRGSFLALRFTDAGRAILFASEEEICKADVLHDKAPSCFSVPAEGDRITAASVQATATLVGNYAGTLFLWANDSGTLVRRWSSSHRAEIVDVAYSSEVARAISAGMEPVVRAWDVNSGRQVDRVTGLPPFATAVSLSDDGSLALVGTEGGTVEVWKVARPSKP